MINMPFDASKGNESGCDATVLLSATFSCSLIEYQTSAPKKFVSLKKGPVPGPTKGVSESVCVNADRFFIRDLLLLRNL